MVARKMGMVVCVAVLAAGLSACGGKSMNDKTEKPMSGGAGGTVMKTPADSGMAKKDDGMMKDDSMKKDDGMKKDGK